MAETTGITQTQTANLLDTTEVEIQRLGSTGIIPKPNNGRYDLIATVKSYVRHLRTPKQTSKADIARLLDMSERNLTEVLRGLNIDYRTASEDVILTAYIRDLRDKAAGRSGDHVIDAAIAKKRNLDINSELQELTLKERMGELLPRQETEQEIITHIISARQEFENNLPDKLEHEIKIIYRLDVPASFFKGIISAALHNFSDRMLKNVHADALSDGGGVGSDKPA